MLLREGPSFSMADPAEVAGHLRGRSVSSFVCPPSALTVRVADDGLLLCHANGRTREFPLRRAFVLKVFRWYNTNHQILETLADGTLAPLLTDLLHGIRSGEVTVHLEGGEALSVTSPRYNLLRDEEVLRACQRIGIDAVSRDDYRLRVYLKIREKSAPVPGDTCGLGFNAFNSETGFSSLKISRYIIRYVCSNGAIVEVGESAQRIHYGHQPGALEDFLHTQLEKASRMQAPVKKSLNDIATASASAHLGAIRKRLGGMIGKWKSDAALAAIGPASTVYDLFNVITAEAKSCDPALRVRLETFAGDLLLARFPISGDTGRHSSLRDADTPF